MWYKLYTEHKRKQRTRINSRLDAYADCLTSEYMNKEQIIIIERKRNKNSCFTRSSRCLSYLRWLIEVTTAHIQLVILLSALCVCFDAACNRFYYFHFRLHELFVCPIFFCVALSIRSMQICNGLRIYVIVVRKLNKNKTSSSTWWR